MLSLDLFNTRYEKKLHEGAVDSTIEHLLKPLSLRAAEIRTKLRGGRLDPKQIDQLEKEYEDLVQKRLDIILNRKKTTEQQVPTQTPSKGQDLVTPQQRVAAATPPKTSMLGKARETFASFANWLAGKDDTGPTYESQLNETDPNSAINAAKYAYEQMRKAHDDNVDIATIRWMNNSDPITMSRNQIYHTLTKLQGMSRQNRNAFALQTMADRNNFYLWLGGQRKVTQRPQLKQPSDPFQQELPLGKPKISPVQERDQKKKSSDPKPGDIKVARELEKLRAQYPAAQSDVERVYRAELDSTERQQKQLAAISGANEKQDALLKQLVSLDREQGREIDSIDTELARVQSVNDKLQQTIASMTGTKKSAAPKTELTTTQKPAEPVTVAPVSDVDPATLKKVQDLENQIQSLQARPKTPQNTSTIADLNRRLSSLQAIVAGEKPDTRPADTFKDLDVTVKPSATRIKQSPRVSAPAADLDLKPAKKAATKSKTAKPRSKKPTVPDDIDLLGIPEPDLLSPQQATVHEHGGGIGPKKHWQSLMRNEGWSDKHNPTPYAVYIDGRQWKEFRSDDEARRVADKVRANLELQGRDQTVTIAPSQTKRVKEATAQQFGQSIRMAGHTGRELEKDPEIRKEFIRTQQQLAQRQKNIDRRDKGYGEEPEDYRDVDETFAMPGTTIPRKSLIQGYTVFYNPNNQMVSVTRGGDSEEAAIEQVRLGTPSIKNFRQATDRLIDKIEKEDEIINEGIKDAASATAVIACLLTGGALSGCATAPQQTTAQQVLKTGQDVGRVVYNAKQITRAGTEAEVQQELINIARGMGSRPEELNNSGIIRVWRMFKGRPPVPAEPQAPEYGPAEPVRRMPQNEAVTKEPTTRKELLDMIDKIQRMSSQERNPANLQIMRKDIDLLKKRYAHLKEDTAALAAEDAILKRIFVRHRDLMMEYGPDKITQAAESVAYNVGDIAHITDEQINEWVGQVEYILGAKP